MSMLDTEEDKNIFKELHDEYKVLMYYKAYGILKDCKLAEDAVQESFIRIIKNFDKFSKEKCPQNRNKIVNIVRMVSIDIYRKRKKCKTVSFDEIERTIIDELAVTDDILESMEFERYLFKLPKSYYVILSLKYNDGYSYKEMAEILDITEENVKKRLTRARNKLREIIKEEEVQF
jgi:RNA polymerase sigma-70 factor (ECF subfamily)